MSRDVNALATAEQIRAIADGAHDMLLDALQEDWDDPEHEAADRLPLALAALRFCARAAQELGDASLFDAIADPFALLVALEAEDDEDVEDVACEATASLLARRERIDDRVIELAADLSPVVRRAIAGGLRPTMPGATALLRKLVADPDPSVRSSARESLGDAAEAPWWTGVLSADPVTVVGEAQAARIRPTLDEILKNLGGAEYARAEGIAATATLARKLPRPIAADVATHALLLVDHASKASIAPLMKLLLAGPRPEEAFDRVLAHWAAQGRAITVDEPVAEAIKALPGKRRAELCRTIARRTLEAPETERLDGTSATSLAASIAGRAWPKPLDYGFVLDGIDAIEREDESEADAATRGLLRLLEVVPPRAAHVPRLVLRFTQPPSESWREVQWWIAPHLQQLAPEALRPVAERAAASAEEHVVRWGLEMLASKARRRGEREEDLFRAWAADPRLLRSLAISQELRAKALPLLRERLRAGALDYDGAVQTILTTGREHGGVRGARKGAPTALAVRDDEWAAYRAARDRMTERDSPFWYHAIYALPPGPARHPADRAFVGQAIEAAREDRAHVAWLCSLLAEVPDAESLAQATRLLAIAQGDDRAKVRGVCDAIATAIGVAPPPDPGADPGTGGAGPPVAQAPRAREWMDEPEDGE